MNNLYDKEENVMINFEKLTELAADSINTGYNETISRGNPEFNTLHLLYGILQGKDPLFFHSLLTQVFRKYTIQSV
jgi:hypothetical protein